MITESDVHQEHPGTTFAWALLASLCVNVLAWIIALWLTNVHLVLPQPKIQEREYQVSSSSITLSHRTVPKPVQRVVPPAPVQPEQRPRVAVAPAKARPETPRPVATNAEHPLSVAEAMQEQQQTLDKAAQAMHDARAPLSIVTMEPRPPSSAHETYADINGVDLREHVEAILLPSGQHRVGNGMSCYYNVHYSAEWSGGGSEEGTIPWPVCYPADHDAMLPLNKVHDLPIPRPCCGYVLPPGTPLSPLLFRIYQGSIHG
jgi:hypothetical protein